MKNKSALMSPASDTTSNNEFSSALLPMEGLTRRNMLKLACASIAATSLGGIAGLIPAAFAQETGDVKAETLRADHFLAKAAIKAARAFPLGKESLNLDLNVGSGIHGAVQEFVHSPEEAKRFGRKTSVLEGTVIALTTGSSGMKAVKKYLAAHGTPKRFEENSNFVAMTIRRRTTNGPDRLNLSKEVAVAEEITFVCGISADDKKHLTAAIVFPTFIGKRTKKPIRPGIHFKQIPASDQSAASPPPASPPPDQSKEEKDFQGCFLGCLAPVGSAGSAAAAPFCVACIATIVALPPTAGLDTPAVLGTCGGCFFFFFAPIAICFGVCADQL